MSEVDADAINVSSKVLTTIFLILIASLNIVMLGKLLVSGDAARSPRRYISGSIAFANMFFALFYLVIQERVLFQDTKGMDCETIMSAEAYFLLHPFVISFTLITMCVEVYARSKIRTTVGNPLFCGVLLAGAPWIFSLIVVLPLHLAGFNQLYCRYEEDGEERARASLVVCYIVAVLLAAIATGILKGSDVAPESEYYQQAAGGTPASAGPMGGMVLQTAHQQPGVMAPVNPYNAPPSGAPVQYGAPPTAPGTQYMAPPTSAPGMQYMTPPTSAPPPAYPGVKAGEHNAAYQAPGQQPLGQHYNAYNQPPVATHYYAPPQQGGYYQPAQPPVQQMTESTETAVARGMREKNLLFTTGCLLALFMLPRAIFVVGYIMEQKSDLGAVAAATLYYGLLYWMYLWGVMYPLVWMRALRNTRNV